MLTNAWASGVMGDLVDLQNKTGIPALAAAAQMCHESDYRGRLSELAEKAHNYAGMKWASWQQEFGCKPVVYGTWEEVDGEAENVDAHFCSCPDWSTWLKVYSSLLTGTTYGFALKYAADPLLYLSQIAPIWATDSRYLRSVSWWVADLWPQYQTTLPVPRWKEIQISCSGESVFGWVTPQGRTITPVRSLAELFGKTVFYDHEKSTVIIY